MLAIAALKMGASEAVGTDTDPLAVQSAACNAGLNGVAAGFRAVQCSAPPSAPEPLAAAGLADVEGSFDICVANILQVWLQPHSMKLSNTDRTLEKYALWSFHRADHRDECHGNVSACTYVKAMALRQHEALPQEPSLESLCCMRRVRCWNWDLGWHPM